MNIRRKIQSACLGVGLLALASSAFASGNVVVGRPYPGYGYYPPPPYAGYVPGPYPYPAPYPAYPYAGYVPNNPALQNPYSPSNPANLYQYMNGRVPPPGGIAPNPLYYDGGSDYYLY